MSCCTTACAPCSRNSAVTRISWPLLRGIHSYGNAVWLLGRMEGKQTSAVLDLVCRDASATGWTLLQRMFTTAYATGTVLGDADSRHPASFRVLALGFLGMDGRCGRICISLCSSFPNAVAGNTVGRVPRAAVARPEMNAPRQRERDKLRQGVVPNTPNLHRNGAVGFIDWLRAVRHNGINRGKGRSTDTLVVVVFGRIGGDRGGAERNPSADYGNGGGQVGKGEAVGGRQVVRVADGRIQHIDVQVEIAEGIR